MVDSGALVAAVAVAVLACVLRTQMLNFRARLKRALNGYWSGGSGAPAQPFVELYLHPDGAALAGGFFGPLELRAPGVLVLISREKSGFDGVVAAKFRVSAGEAWGGALSDRALRGTLTLSSGTAPSGTARLAEPASRVVMQTAFVMDIAGGELLLGAGPLLRRNPEATAAAHAAAALAKKEEAAPTPPPPN